MRPTLIQIRGGRVVDPANDVDRVKDLWIEDGRIIANPTEPATKADRVIDATGCVVMPGGVDVHSHIAGAKVNAARLLRPEEARDHEPLSRRGARRSGTGGSVPTTFSTGHKYAALGYTTAVDAAIAPLMARGAHQEFADTPGIDKAMLVLMGNNHYVMDCVREGAHARLRDYVAWLIQSTGAFGVKVVDPGGVEHWKHAAGRLSELDDEVAGFGITPRAIVTALARAVDELALPHPLHVHGMRLGVPGCADASLQLLDALDGHRVHLAHIQFLSYSGQADDPSSLGSGVGPLCDYVNTHSHISCDVGQVLFGETTSMTADGPVGEFLHRVTGRRWLSHDVELETGCGVVPVEYRDTNFVHALQWCIGLEWFLRITDPWKLSLSTDHPNGATFWSYPKIIALLMNRTLREETFDRLPKRARERSLLRELDREYSLAEIAIITRAAPARMLGLSDRGHLAPGARADVAVYSISNDIERMFAMPRWVLKRGEIVMEDGELRSLPQGDVLRTRPVYDPAVIPSIRRWFDSESSIRFANFALSDAELGQ